MQLFLTFSRPSAALPINYRRLLHRMIYRFMSADAEFSGATHDSLIPGVDGRSFKGFTFSPLMGPYAVEGHTIRFLDKVTLEIRSRDPDMIRLLFGGFSRADTVSVGTETLRILGCETADRVLDVPSARVAMLSPVVAYATDADKHTLFFRPDEDRFYAALLHNAERKNRLFQPRVPFDLNIRLLDAKLPASQFSRFKNTYILGWFGRYLLEGDPRVINLLYQTGLGAKNSEGYGLFSVN